MQENNRKQNERRLTLGVCLSSALIFILVLCFASSLALVASSCKTTDPDPTLPPVTVIPVVASAEPTDEPAPLPELALDAVYGRVAASDGLSYGLSTCGLLSYIGRSNGRASCYDWRGVCNIDASSSLTCALTRSGGVLVSGNDELSEKTAEWSDAVSVCCTDGAVFALKRDGSVLSTDDSAAALSNIRLIAASDKYFIAFSTSGEVSTLGAAPNVSALGGVALVSVDAGPTHVVGVTSEGKLVSTREGDRFNGVDCKKAFCGEDCTAYIDENDRLNTDCAHFVRPDSPSDPLPDRLKLDMQLGDSNALVITAQLENAVDFACCSTHALALVSDGTVIARGDNEYLERNVDDWRLLPYASGDGYILGIAPESRFENGAPIRTGDSYTLPDGTSGTVVILGDIDMDGMIGESDLGLLENYLTIGLELSAAQLRAANIIRDPEKPDSIDSADLEQLRYHINGFVVIDQYAKDFVYMKEIANAERTNKDVCGYLRLDNTNIDVPVMYGDDFYYHYHTWTGSPSGNGSVYLYFNYPSRNTVITGHNLRARGTMLHDLHKLQDRYAQSYGVFENRVWTINLFGQTHLYEVFAMYEEKPRNTSETSQYYNCCYDHTMESMSDEQISKWIAYQNARTELSYSVETDPSDRFVTVLTCSDTHAESDRGGRIYFFLRQVDGH